MDDRSFCPSESALRDFLVGQLPEDEGIRIAIHLENCAQCEQLLEQLRETDTAAIGVSLEVSVPPIDPFAVTRSHSTDNQLLDQLERAEDRFDYTLLAHSERAAAIGRLGKYDVMREMGHGGYGVVFEGWDEQLRRAVAMKVLNRELSCSAVARRRFLREARAAAAINHPNVVTIHAVEEHEGIPFLVMELVSGGSLRDWIRTGPKPTIFDVLRIGWQVANGLAAAHSQGVIHRDIKPANILLVDGLERIKITDFGLARVTVDNVDLTSREIAVGTPTYMSPEQVSGASVDARSDLFSLGCVLYAMFVGHSPFHGRTALEVARKIADEIQVPLHVAEPSIPRFISEIIGRLLAKSPDDRFQSAAELAELLKHHLALLNQTPSDELDAALHAASYQQPRKPSPRWRKIRMSGGVVTGCFGVVALIWLLWFRPWIHHSEPTADRDRPPSSGSVEPGVQKDLVTVSKTKRADCRTLVEALKWVRPYGKIRVLDDQTYDEGVFINDGAALRGITIDATHGAVLTASSGTVLTIHDTPEVTIRGFRMQLPNHQHGIEVTGDCHGLLIENIYVTTTPGNNESCGLLYVHAGASGTAEQPMTVRNLHVLDRRNAVVIGEQHGRVEQPVKWCLLEDCQFHGPAGATGFRCVLFGGIEHVTMRRCVITRGECAFSVARGGSETIESLRDVTIQNCTLYDVNSWLIWRMSATQSERILWRDNLILKSNGIDFPDLELVSSKWFMNNWWEVGGAMPAQAGYIGKTFAHIPLLSTDAASPDYLKPDLDQLADQVRPDAIIPGVHSQAE